MSPFTFHFAAFSLIIGLTLIGFRTALSVLLDDFRLFMSDVETQPEHTLSYIVVRKTLAQKCVSFYRTFEEACLVRSKAGIRRQFVAPLVTRGLRPMEARDKDGGAVQGWTWMDRLLTVGNSAVSFDGKCCKEFMVRISCPVLVVVASNDSLRQTEGGFCFLKKRQEKRYDVLQQFIARMGSKKNRLCN